MAERAYRTPPQLAAVSPDAAPRELELLKADLGLRLRGVCSHFPDSEFDALIDQIARVEMKYALRAATSEERASHSP